MSNKFKIFTELRENDVNFKNYSDRVQEQNAITLNNISMLMSTVLSLLFIASLLLDFLSRLTILYGVFAALTCVETIVFVPIMKKYKNLARPFFYIMIFTIAMFTIILGTYYSPTLPATMFLVFLLVVPLVFFERPLYITIISLVCVAIFLLSSYYNKDSLSFRSDAVNCISDLVIAVGLIYYMSVIKMRNLELTRSLESKCSLDELTAIPNRRSINQYLENIKNCFNDDTEIGLCMIDVDDFKLYNDTCGHLQGDDALSFAAKTLYSVADKNKIHFARFGGEEFIAVFVGKDKAFAEELCKDFIDAVNMLSIEFKAVKKGKLTISVGCAFKSNVNAKSSVDFINAADAALYKVKENGKDGYNII